MLMQTILGADWDKLPPVIQHHYDLADQQNSCIEGEMRIHYPSFMLPMIWLIHLFGGLILWRGEAVQTRVQKTARGSSLQWQRFMSYSDDKSDYFGSEMRPIAEHQLVEYTGFGFGLRLIVDVNNGDLCYRGNGHFWQCGAFVLTIPDWLLLGTATISEHALSDDEFYLDFTIKHPWWGETYSYRGKFRHC